MGGLPVIVAGGGIGGLTAALALARRGLPVRLYERAAGFGEVGAGLQLGPNAMRVLAALGLADAVTDAGFRPRALEMRLGGSGRTVFRLPVNRGEGPPYVQIHRADLIRILLDAAHAAGVALVPGRAVADLAQDRRAVLVRLEDGEEVAGRALIGADGIGSTVQRRLFGPAPARFTGQVAWRATIPAEALAQGLVAPHATVWVGAGRHLVSYFLRGGRLVNLVAVEERADWTRESWTDRGDPAALRAAFAGWHPRVTGLIGAVRDCFLWALHDRPPLPRWSVGRVTLLGDACHPMLPFMAQGAAMAIEDAHVLAACLAAGPEAPALARYEALRRARTARVQAAARRNAWRFHLKGRLARLAVYGPMAAASLAAPGLLRGALAWLYDHDATRAGGPGG